MKRYIVTYTTCTVKHPSRGRTHKHECRSHAGMNRFTKLLDLGIKLGIVGGYCAGIHNVL